MRQNRRHAGALRVLALSVCLWRHSSLRPSKSWRRMPGVSWEVLGRQFVVLGISIPYNSELSGVLLSLLFRSP
jgi:hypothetical protein